MPASIRTVSRPGLVPRALAATLSLLLCAPAAAQQAAPAGPPPSPAPADSIDALIASGELIRTMNPVAARFLFAEGAGHLPADLQQRAREQLMRALKSQTDGMRITMQGAAGMLNAPTMQQLMKTKGNVLLNGALGELGVAPSTPRVDTNRMQEEARQAMVDPWVRGIESAQALEQGGDARAAANFYVNCLQMLQAKWVPDACLQGIVDLGAKRAEPVFTWMLDNADSISVTNPAAFAAPGAPAPKKPKDAPLDQGTVQLRNAALEGLGALVGQGDLDAPVREQAMTKLLAFAAGKDNEPYYQGAAEGLGRSKDPRAIEPLRRLSHAHGTPELRQAAWRGLAVGFHDDGAIHEVRSALGDQDPDEQLRASQALYEIGDEAAFRWAVDTIERHRTSESTKPDVRPQVVRDLVELGGPPARSALAKALSAGAGNDWLDAWVAVGLLELGDTTQLPRVEQALKKTDWSLDPRGFRSILRSIAPFISLAAQIALSGGAAAPSALQQVKQIVQVVGNFATGERSRYLAKAGLRESVTAQFRWQAADALAAAHPPGAAKLLESLLDDPAMPVRTSAAQALARVDDPEAIGGIARAYALDYGGEDASRTPAIRAALLRAALLRFPAAPETRQLVTSARGDADAGLRLIAFAAGAGG